MGKKTTNRGIFSPIYVYMYMYVYIYMYMNREIEKFITRQPPIGKKDDYDSENSWISDGLPSSSRRRSA